jgi:hypothetical protein
MTVGNYIKTNTGGKEKERRGLRQERAFARYRAGGTPALLSRAVVTLPCGATLPLAAALRELSLRDANLREGGGRIWRSVP